MRGDVNLNDLIDQRINLRFENLLAQRGAGRTSAAARRGQRKVQNLAT